MAVYALGDIQGCYAKLCELLDKLHFDPAQDQLWFCGDLVNRGPDSLETLRFIRALGDSAITVLGNHDLHLLALYHKQQAQREPDTLTQVLDSPDCDELMLWLQSRPLAHYDADLKFLMVHAGIHREWDLTLTLHHAREIERALQSSGYADYFAAMYGDTPDLWNEDLSGMERLRCITNIFTRLRFYFPDERLDFSAKGSPKQHAAQGLIPWFVLEGKLEPEIRLVFGHWSTLAVGKYGQNYAIDAGCVWGGGLAAIRIDSSDPEWHKVNCAN